MYDNSPDSSKEGSNWSRCIFFIRTCRVRGSTRAYPCPNVARVLIPKSTAMTNFIAFNLFFFRLSDAIQAFFSPSGNLSPVWQSTENGPQALSRGFGALLRTLPLASTRVSSSTYGKPQPLTRCLSNVANKWKIQCTKSKYQKLERNCNTSENWEF